MEPAGTTYCPSCGGLRPSSRKGCPNCPPLPEPAHGLSCPRCHEALRPERPTEGTFGRCLSCHGLWLDHDEVRDLVDLRVRRASAPRVAAGESTGAAERGGHVTIACPRCDRKMLVRPVAPSCDVVVDVCRTHGLWFDGRELERFRAFVDGGGLEGETKPRRTRRGSWRRHDLSQRGVGFEALGFHLIGMPYLAYLALSRPPRR